MRGPINQESITTDESVEAKLVADIKKKQQRFKVQKTNQLSKAV
jgi:hypothetical protein